MPMTKTTTHALTFGKPQHSPVAANGGIQNTPALSTGLPCVSQAPSAALGKKSHISSLVNGILVLPSPKFSFKKF